MEWVWRIVISLSVLVTGLLGSLMTLGLGIYIVFADSLDGNFWYDEFYQFNRCPDFLSPSLFNWLCTAIHVCKTKK